MAVRISQWSWVGPCSARYLPAVHKSFRFITLVIRSCFQFLRNVAYEKRQEGLGIIKVRGVCHMGISGYRTIWGTVICYNMVDGCR